MGALLGVGVYGVTQLEIDYDAVWYMRESSYQQHFYLTAQDYFPEDGARVEVYVGKIFLDFSKVPELKLNLNSSPTKSQRIFLARKTSPAKKSPRLRLRRQILRHE